MQDEDGEEEDEDAEDSGADGFVVPNGYVSDDEGVASAQQELDAQAGELSEGARAPPPPFGGWCSMRIVHACHARMSMPAVSWAAPGTVCDKRWAQRQGDCMMASYVLLRKVTGMLHGSTLLVGQDEQM
jgi:hypothetical protein